MRRLTPGRCWPARGARRINAVLAAVRGMVVHAVAAGQAGSHLVPLLYEVADDRDLPGAVRGEDGAMSWRMRARHRLHEPEQPVDRAADAGIVAVLGACLSARDRLIVLLMARAGLRRGEALGLRRSDVHLLLDSRLLGCEIPRAHVHVVRRDDNPNGAQAKSRRQRAVPLDFVTVQAFDTYDLERMGVPRAADSDFVLSGCRDNRNCPDLAVIPGIGLVRRSAGWLCRGCRITPGGHRLSRKARSWSGGL
jgi:integrase/recombinase XerD